MAILAERDFPFAKYPAVRLVICYASGLIIGPELNSYVIFFIILCWGVTEIALRLRPKPSFSVINCTVYLSLVFLFGGYYSSWMNDSHRAPSHSLDFFQADTLILTGKITHAGPTSTGRYSLVMKTDFGEKIRLRYDQADPEGFYSGMKLRVPVRLYPFPEKRNPYEFDFANWLIRQGIHHHAIVAGDVQVLKHVSPVSWNFLRKVLNERIRKNFSAKNQALCRAILLGYKSELDPDMRKAFSRAGLSHIMAVSGMHVGFILMPLWVAIPMFWVSKRGRITGFLLIFTVLFFYAGITGFTASVNRASVMAILLAWGKLFQKIRDGINLMGVAALLMLIFNPDFIHDVGFQLSFSAVTIIFLLMPVYQKLIPIAYRFGRTGNFLSFLGVSAIVQAGLYPVLVWYFGEYSWAGPASNILAVPITQALFLWSFATLPLTFIAGQWAAVISLPADWLATGLVWIAASVEAVDGAWSEASRPGGWFFACWVSGVGFLAAIPYARRRWKLLAVLIIFLNISLASQILDRMNPAGLEVVFYDVGQGDAVFIRTPSGRVIMYDTGVWTPSRDSGRDVILPDLKARGVAKVDMIILSHPHGDHIGGVRSIMENIPVGIIYHAGFEYPTALNLGWFAAARRHGIEVQELMRGMEISPDPAVRIFVVHPASIKSGRDPNPHSVVIKLVYGHISVLLTGDADHLAESVMIRQYDSLLQSSVLKAGHHGSKTSSTLEFMETVAPDWVVVSLAYRNRYRHPHIEASRNLTLVGKNVRYTSLHSAQIFTTDGVSLINTCGNQLLCND